MTLAVTALQNNYSTFFHFKACKSCLFSEPQHTNIDSPNKKKLQINLTCLTSNLRETSEA